MSITDASAPAVVERPIQLIMRPLGNGYKVTSSGHASLVNRDDLRVDPRTTGNTATIPLAVGPVLIAHWAVLIDRIYYELIIAKGEPGRDPPEEVSVGLYKGDRKELFRLEKGTMKEVTLWSSLPWGKTTLTDKELLAKMYEAGQGLLDKQRYSIFDNNCQTFVAKFVKLIPGANAPPTFSEKKLFLQRRPLVFEPVPTGKKSDDLDGDIPE